MGLKDYNSKEFGFKLRSVREKNYIKQQVAADDLGIGIRALRNIESGAADINIKQLLKIAELYKTSVSKLLDLEETAIVNSFNTVQEQGHALNLAYTSGTTTVMDKSWVEETYKRFAFLEKNIEFLQKVIEDLRVIR